MNSYHTYRGLPAMAGLCSLEEAMQHGLSIEDGVSRLKRFHWALEKLHQIFMARLTSEPVYELKMAFSLHGHYCAEHVGALAKRVGEMREPPLGLDVVPDENFDLVFSEVLNAPTTAELLLGVYGVILPALRPAIQRYQRETNPLADAPSRRVLRHALIEVEDMLTYGQRALDCLVSAEQREQSAAWLQLLADAFTAAGDFDGSKTPVAKTLVKRYAAKPFVYDRIPKRDERFPDPYNMGVNAEVFLYDEKYPPQAKTLMMFYKRLREIDVPEMMASIIVETSGKPWGYYQDMTRQLWDEARHAMMGEVGFANLGVNWPKNVMINSTWSMGLNTQLTPMERHGVLYFIEQGLMPKTGKRFEWEVGQASQNPIAALFQDYDWADEVLHARIGRDWYLKNFDHAREGVEYGDKAWSKVLMGWKQWRDEGLTEHRNWWPDCYRDACKSWGITPDPEVLAYKTSYEQVRADLKNLSASA